MLTSSPTLATIPELDTIAPEREKFVYRPTWGDLKAIEKQLRATNLALQVHYLARTVAVPLIIVGVPLWTVFTEGFESLRKVGWFSLVPAAVVVTIFSVFEYSRRSSIKKSGVLDSDVETALRDEGLWLKDRNGEAVAFWSSIKSISETQAYFFFRTKASDLFHLVPKRVFANPEAAAAFHAEAMRLWKANQAEPNKDEKRAD